MADSVRTRGFTKMKVNIFCRERPFKTRFASGRTWLLLWLLLTTIFPASAQQKEQPTSDQMGVSTAGSHEAVKDAQHRPITAGGFVDNAPVVFTDITRQSG